MAAMMLRLPHAAPLMSAAPFSQMKSITVNENVDVGPRDMGDGSESGL